MSFFSMMKEADTKCVRVWFECQRCKVMWSPTPESTDQAIESQWLCPKGCNSPKNLH
jgi:hypothetical protein